jgi:hypothetical protein
MQAKDYKQTSSRLSFYNIEGISKVSNKSTSKHSANFKNTEKLPS